MAKRKSARRRRSRKPETVKEMAAYLRQMAANGEQNVGTPTPERAIRAGGQLRQGADRVFRIEDSPLQKLAARNALVPGDKVLNRVLLDAGERFASHRHLGKLDSLASIDLLSTGGHPDPSPGAPSAFTSETIMHHRREYRSAINKLDPWVWPVLHAIVINERNLEEAAAMFTEYRDRAKGTAVVLDRLRGGLIRLAVHFHLASPKAFGVREVDDLLDASRLQSHDLRYESELRPAARSRASAVSLYGHKLA